MLDKLSQEERAVLIEELKACGYTVTISSKAAILRQELEKLGMVDCFIAQEVSRPIYLIADWATNNTEQKRCGNGFRTEKKQTVDPDIENEYRTICKGILEVLKPYYGRDGFKSIH